MRNPLTINSPSCDEIRENLSAQFDKEALTVAEAVIQDHLNQCGECSCYKDVLKSLHDRLCRELADRCDPNDLWENVRQRIDEYETAVKIDCQDSTPTQGRMRRKTVFALAASVLMCVLVSGFITSQRHDSSLRLTTETLRDYETFRVRGSQLDIEVSSSDELVEWMTGKLSLTTPRR